MKRIALAVVPLTIFLVGCGSDAPGSGTETKVPAERVYRVNIGDGTVDPVIYRVTIDGMDCLMNFEGALTCDWAGTNTEPTY